MSRLRLFRGIYKHSILVSGTKKMNLPELVNDQLEKRIEIRQRGGEQKQKPHSDLEENDIHSKSAVTLAFGFFFMISLPHPHSPPAFSIAYFLVLLPKTLYFSLFCHLPQTKAQDLGKRIREREIPILTFISSVTLTKSTNLLFPLLQQNGQE